MEKLLEIVFVALAVLAATFWLARRYVFKSKDAPIPCSSGCDCPKPETLKRTERKPAETAGST